MQAGCQENVGVIGIKGQVVIGGVGLDVVVCLLLEAAMSMANDAKGL